LLCLSIACATGTLAGLRSPGALAALSAGGALAAGFVALRARRNPRRSIGSRLGSGAALLFGGLLIGGLLGAPIGELRRSACAGDLLTGDTVTAVGIVAGRAGAAGRDRYRLRLRDITLSAGNLTCRLPGVLARVSAAEPPTPGARVRVAGEWMRFVGSDEWPAAPDRQGMVSAGSIAASDAVPVPPLLRLRARAAERLIRRLPPDVAPTALALLLSERDEIDPDLRRRFVEAGLAHLLAISGMHVGMLAAGAVWLLGLGLGVRRRVPLAFGLVAIYVLLIGAPPAARRALAGFACYAWARVRGWPTRPSELVGAALLAVVAASPGSLLDPGLQLSFAGIAGVILGDRVAAMLRAGRGWQAKLFRAAGAGAGAVLATTPLTAYHFGQASAASLVSHFVGAPLVGIGLGSLAATLAAPDWMAAPAADLATGTLRSLHAAADLFSRVPGGHRSVAAPTAALWVAWILCLDAGRRVVARGRPRAALGPLGFAAVVVVGGPVLDGIGRAPALLCTLSVGQGDAAVLRTGSGRWLVFDGGPAWGDWNAGRAIVHPFLRRHGAAQVELAVLSHPDLDHLGGLRGLLPEIRVERVLDTGDAVPSGAYADFLAEIDAAGVRWLPAAAGDRLRVDDAVLTVLGPSREGAMSGANATSLSFRLVVEGGFRYVNTGDATADEEAALLRAWPAESLRADVLKVGHHGSRTSSDLSFLRAVGATVAVVSAGAGNRYGHPHAEVLARLHAAGVGRVWRTDRHGTLCVEIGSGGRWRVRGETTWRQPGA